MSGKIRHGIGILLIGVAISILVWSEWRFPREIKNSPINFPELELSEISNSSSLISEPDTAGVFTPTQILGEENAVELSDASMNHLVFDFPTKVRVGDTDIIRLDLIRDAPGKGIETAGTPDGKVNTAPDAGSPIFSRYNVLVETRLDLAGILFTPTGDIITPFQPDRVTRFYWTIQPDKAGIYRGVLWLHSQYVAKVGNETIRGLLSTQLIELSAVSFFGLRSDIARLLGSTGFFIGLALELDFIIEFISKSKKGKQPHA